MFKVQLTVTFSAAGSLLSFFHPMHFSSIGRMQSVTDFHMNHAVQEEGYSSVLYSCLEVWRQNPTVKVRVKYVWFGNTPYWFYLKPFVIYCVSVAPSFPKQVLFRANLFFHFLKKLPSSLNISREKNFWCEYVWKVLKPEWATVWSIFL